jgi:osmotically-inducible protein OsmY
LWTTWRSSYLRNAETDAASIHVDTEGSNVTVSGKVHSWSEREEVIRAAWAAPGVHQVQSDLIVIE